MSDYPLVPDRARQRGLVVVPEPYGDVPTGHGSPLRLQNALLILRRNALLITAIVAVTTGVAWYRFSQQLPQYKASALVRLVDVRRTMTGGLGAGGADFESWRLDPLKSQLEILKGRATLGEIVDSLGLRLTVDPPDRASLIRSVVAAEVPEESAASVHLLFGQNTFTATSENTTREVAYGDTLALGPSRFTVTADAGVPEATVAVMPRESAISSLGGSLQLRLREGTDVVDVEYTAYDRSLAQEVVNASIGVFQSASAHGARQESRRRRIFLEEQLRGTDATFREVQAALSDFRARQQVFSSREQLSSQQEGLRDLDVRREEMAADKRIYEAALGEMQRPGSVRADVLRRVSGAPGMAANPVVAQLYTQMLQQQATRDSLTAAGATSNHPDVRRLDNALTASEGRLVDAIRSHVASLDARLGALDALRTQSAGQMQILPTSEAEEVRLAQQVEATSRMADQLREELQRARIAEAVESGQVQIVNRAPMAGSVGAPMTIKMAIALFFGFGLGIGAAFLRSHLDTTIRDREEVERIIRAPKLATIPRLVGGPTRVNRVKHFLRRNGAATARRNTLVALNHATSWEAEAYRTLRTNLIFSQAIRSLRTIVITSSVPGEGKTTTAGNLAIAFAQQGLRVLLVDCDLRKPAVHRVFDLATDPGLTQLALGFAKDDEAIRSTEVKGLFILPAGTLPPNPAELLGGPNVPALLARLGAEFDMVLLDTSPIMAASDAAILASHADGVLIVVRAGFADRNAVELAAQQLATVGARIIGAVFNDADSRAWPYERSYHYKEYHKDA